MTEFEYQEMDSALESVFDVAMEATSHTIDPKVREKLPDYCFGVIEEFPSGEKKRIYPLRVPKDPQKTKELTTKAIQMFHYCKPDRRKQLAESIVKVIKQENMTISIARTNQMFKYVSITSLPKSVTITEPKARSKRKA